MQSGLNAGLGGVSNSYPKPRYPWKKLEEIDCLRLAKKFAPAWKMVAVELGFDYWEIQTMEAETTGASILMKATGMLIKWTQLKVDDANINTLIDVLERLKIHNRNM